MMTTTTDTNTAGTKDRPRKTGLGKLLVVGLALVVAGVAIRLITTDSLARWQAGRTPDDRLAQEAASPGASVPVLLEWAKRLEAVGRTEEAGRVYARAAQANAARSDAWLGMARTAFAFGNWGHAEQILDKVLKEWPDNAEAHFLLAGVYGNTFRPNAARSHLREGLRYDPDNRAPLLTLGRLELKLKNPAGAVAAFEKAARLGPDLPGLHAPYGEALLETNRVPEAVSQLRLALKADPSDLPSRLNLGRALVKTGKGDDRMEGMKEISRTAEFSANKAPAFLEAAKVWIAENNRSDAEQSLEHAVDADGKNVDALRLLVKTYREGPRPGIADRFVPRLKSLEETERQRAELKARIEAGTNVVGNLVALGDLNAKAGDAAEARSAYAAARGLDPKNAAAAEGLARLAKPPAPAPR